MEPPRSVSYNASDRYIQSRRQVRSHSTLKIWQQARQESLKWVFRRGDSGAKTRQACGVHAGGLGIGGSYPRHHAPFGVWGTDRETTGNPPTNHLCPARAKLLTGPGGPAGKETSRLSCSLCAVGSAALNSPILHIDLPAMAERPRTSRRGAHHQNADSYPPCLGWGPGPGRKSMTLAGGNEDCSRATGAFHGRYNFKQCLAAVRRARPPSRVSPPCFC